MKAPTGPTVLACLLMLTNCLSAASPVQRKTNDRSGDLIVALVSKQRHDDAETVCRWQLDQFQKTDDGYALATTRLAKVFIAKQISKGHFDQAAVASAQNPINQLLRQYPDHRRRLFLEAAKIHVRQMATAMEVSGAAINLKNQNQTQLAMIRLTRLTRDAQSLLESILQSDHRDPSMQADLRRLEQEILVSTVSMALMQTDLFIADSDDQVAAATAAMEAASRARLKLPADSQAADEIQRMEITAVLRSGDAKLALSRLGALTSQLDADPSVALQALRVDCLLALNQNDQAGEVLSRAKASSIGQDEPSIPLDLANLRYLLAIGNDGAAAQWIVDIQRRHGLYARRLAEALVISKMDQIPNAAGPSSSIALVETRGRQLIRDGELAEGGRMLARAADGQSDPDRAFEIAITAAAAFQKAERMQEGSDVLTNVAKKHSSASKASALDLQAIVMLTAGNPPATRDQVENRLRQHLKTWPNSDTSKPAQSWLIPMLEKKWTEAFESAQSDDERSKLTVQAQAAFASLASTPEVVSAHRQLAASYFERSALKILPGPAPPEPNWVDPVIRFRRDGDAEPSPQEIGQNLEAIKRRLIRDGQADQTIRKRIAKLLVKWNDHSAIDQVAIELWLGNVSKAVSVTDALLKDNHQVDRLVQAATLFQESDSPESQRAAIRLWDQLAAGSAVGSEPWHRGKLAAIRLLDRIGKKAEASKRSQYILLTLTNLTEAQKTSYQSFRALGNQR